MHRVTYLEGNFQGDLEVSDVTGVLFLDLFCVFALFQHLKGLCKDCEVVFLCKR